MSRIPLFRYGDRPEVSVLRRWHGFLIKQPQRGTRAALRRARTIADAAQTIGCHDFLRQLEDKLEVRYRPSIDDARLMSALAATAAICAHIGGHRNGALGIQLGSPANNSSSPTASPARLRRLLEAEDLETRFTVLRRLVPLLGGINDRPADLGQLAAVLCDWTPARQRQIAYDYYRATPEK